MNVLRFLVIFSSPALGLATNAARSGDSPSTLYQPHPRGSIPPRDASLSSVRTRTLSTGAGGEPTPIEIFVQRATVIVRRCDGHEPGNFVAPLGHEVDVQGIERIRQAGRRVPRMLTHFRGVHLVADSVDGLTVALVGDRQRELHAPYLTRSASPTSQSATPCVHDRVDRRCGDYSARFGRARQYSRIS